MTTQSMIPAKRDTEMLSVCIPFTGFYGTLWEDDIDQAVNSYFDYEGDGEEGHFNDENFDACDFHAIQVEYCKQYVQAFANHIEHLTGIACEFEFEQMDSPKYYNFETDRIFAKLSIATLGKLLAYSKSNNCLCDAIKERFTHRDGFISSYSNDCEKWAEKPLASWDHNELGTILEAIVDVNDHDLELYYTVTEHVKCSEWIGEHIDESKIGLTYSQWQAAKEQAANQMELPL